MAKETKSTIMVATISAISAIFIALITTLGTIYVSASEAKDVKRELEGISGLKIVNLPVGTIVPSMLPWSKFAQEVGDPDPSVFDPGKSLWALSDGRDVTISQYCQLTGNTKTPDLRGMFLRGMNDGRKDGREDPEPNRTVGSYQADIFKTHRHIIGETWDNKGVELYRYALSKGPAPKDNFLTRYEGGDETRPKNAAVYFYIKINLPDMTTEK